MVKRSPVLLTLAVLAAVPGVLGAFPVSVVDDRCQEVTVEESPQRIVVLLPLYAKILLDLEVGEKIVGIANFSEDLALLTGVSSVGPDYAASREKIVALRPDLVLGATDWNNLRSALESVGTTVLTVGCFAGVPDFGVISGPSDVFRAIEAVASVTTGTAGSVIIERIREDLAAVATAVAGAARPSVAVLYPDSSGVAAPTSAGRGTPEYAVLEAAGGKMVFDHLGYIQVSVEELILADPQFLFLDPARVVGLMQDARFAKMWAVRKRQVCGIKASSWTSSEVGETVRKIAVLLHPIAFAKTPVRCEVPL